MDYFPCPICRQLIPVKYTKNRKPYCTCNECGVQLFIRGKPGIKLFEKLLGKTTAEKNSVELLRITDHFGALKAKLADIISQKPLFSTDPDLEMAEELLTDQIKKVRIQLKKIQPQIRENDDSKSLK